MADQIELISLKFSYFKGLINFTLQADGEDVDVYGDNAAGKTTLFDGFCWLLFGKDSRDKAKPEKWIKTLQDGKPLGNIEHEVEGELMVNGRRKVFRKVFFEKMTKKRGSADAEFDGHKTTHFVDGAPISAAEYEAEIATVINEVQFKLLTSPTYFNEQLDKNKRRQLLLEVCGDLTDDQVIASNTELSALPSMMEDRTMDRHRAKIKGDQTRINKELEDIPVRISEVQRGMPDTGGLDEATVKEQIDAMRGRIEGKDAEMTRIQSGGEIAIKTTRLREIEGELLQIKNAIQSESLAKTGEQRQLVSKHRGRVADMEAGIKQTERQISSLQRQIQESEDEREPLRKVLHNLKESIFTHTDKDVCDTCGQSLPEGDVAAARERAEGHFNQHKAESLKATREKGQKLKRLADEWQAEIDLLTQKLEADRASLDAAATDADMAKATLEQMEAAVQDVDTDPAYIAKLKDKAAVEQKILELHSSSLSSLEAARTDLAALRTELQSMERKYASFGQVKESNARIAELKKQEKLLAAQYAELEKQLFLTEEFIRTKVRLLESKINAKFKHVRFRLFNVLVNGAVEETCDTLYGKDLVPYGQGLNRAAEINAGLDIINTLSEHYGFVAPIFIDNAEAVTELAETSGQQIRLIVSKPDKQLRVEPVNHN